MQSSRVSEAVNVQCGPRRGYRIRTEIVLRKGGGTLFREVLGWSTPWKKRLWSCYFNAPQTVFISCLVYRRTASGLTSHKSNYRHHGSNFSPFPFRTIVLRCRTERKNCASFDIKQIRLLGFRE